MTAGTPAVLAFGSNLGDREGTIRAAIAELDRTPGIRVIAVSSLIETPALKPTGIDPQAPAYLNGVAMVQTTLAPEELLDVVAGVELRHGRLRAERWGDRTLDIDIITIDEVRLDGERLTLPHPRAHERDFVLAPWLEVDPDAHLPGHGPVAELLAAVRGGL